jgi:energy-coupling factor transporter transmembrane protein EcfT
MDTARQVLRFSIPGSVTLLLVIGYLILGRMLQHDDWNGISAAVSENVSAVVAIVAAIPLGFVIYQVYYASYRALVWPWPWPVARDHHWVRIDRGQQILSRLPADQITRIENTFEIELDLTPALEPTTSWIGQLGHANKLREEYKSRKIDPAIEPVDPYERYKRRWRRNWDVVRALMELSDGTETGSGIKAEYVTLSDLYHALGACRTGVQIAWFVAAVPSLAYVFAGEDPVGSALALLITLLISLAFFSIFHLTRGRTWTSAQAAMALGLTGLLKRKPELLA